MPLLLLLIFTFQLNISHHDVPIAMFRIQQAATTLTLDLSLDAEDLAKEIKLPSTKITKSVFQQYLNANTSFRFNDQDNTLLIMDLNLSGDHFKVKAIFEIPVSTIKKLEITNTCLLQVPKQSNILQIDINKTTKDFRMHYQRKKITVTY